MNANLPAVVLGIDTPIGLTIIRDLGSHGIPVIGIGRTADALGMHSRFLRRGLVRPATHEALIEQLVELGAELGKACLFAVSEGDITLLNKHRERLGAYKIMFEDESRMTRVLDKAQTYAAAAKVGIRTPRTEQPANMAEAEMASKALRYPVVLKWANPYEAQSRLKPFGIEVEKMRYCHSAQELLAYLKLFELPGTYPLIQEYCAGNGLGQFVLMKDGKAHYTFQHYRVHEWPPEGGFSSMCESIGLDQHQDLMDKSIALLRELGWEGVAMVEYRYDSATGEAALMEINGRFWGSLPLAYHAGARFPTMCYRLLGLGEEVRQSPYRAGVRCRFMIPETKRLLRILFAQHKIVDRKLSFARVPELLGYLGHFVRPRTCYYVFDRSDPRPFFADLAQLFRKALRLGGAKHIAVQAQTGARAHLDKDSRAN